MPSTVTTDNQNNFGLGEVRREFLGNQESAEFRVTVKTAVNCDILKQRALRKRDGTKVKYATQLAFPSWNGKEVTSTRTVEKFGQDWSEGAVVLNTDAEAVLGFDTTKTPPASVSGNGYRNSVVKGTWTLTNYRVYEFDTMVIVVSLLTGGFGLARTSEDMFQEYPRTWNKRRYRQSSETVTFMVSVFERDAFEARTKSIWDFKPEELFLILNANLFYEKDNIDEDRYKVLDTLDIGTLAFAQRQEIKLPYHDLGLMQVQVRRVSNRKYMVLLPNLTTVVQGDLPIYIQEDPLGVMRPSYVGTEYITETKAKRDEGVTDPLKLVSVPETYSLGFNTRTDFQAFQFREQPSLRITFNDGQTTKTTRESRPIYKAEGLHASQFPSAITATSEVKGQDGYDAHVQGLPSVYRYTVRGTFVRAKTKDRQGRDIEENTQENNFFATFPKGYRVTYNSTSEAFEDNRDEVFLRKARDEDDEQNSIYRPLVESSKVYGDQLRLSQKFPATYHPGPWYGRPAYAPPDLLDRCITDPGPTGFGGLLIVRVNPKDEQGSLVPRKDLLCRVQRLNTEYYNTAKPERDDSETFNCFLSFLTNSMLEYETELAFDDAEDLIRGVQSFGAISHFAIVGFSLGRGFPRAVTSIGGRTVLSGMQHSDVILASRVGIPFGFTTHLIDQYTLDDAIVEKIRLATETDDREKVLTKTERGQIAPKQFEPTDKHFAYQLQINPHLWSIFANVDLRQGGEIKWVAGHRTLFIGTTSGEIRVLTPGGRGLVAGQIDVTNYESYQGSSSPLTATGDYAIFFVGPSGEEIYYMWFDERISGMRAPDATVIGGGFFRGKEIRDLRWDARRKALWVLYGTKGKVASEVALFFLRQDYKVAGWTRYSFSEVVWGLFVGDNHELGILTPNGLRVLAEDKENLHEDVGNTPITTEVEFWRKSPMGQRGPTNMWKVNVGKTLLGVTGVSELFVGEGAGRREYIRPNVSNLLLDSDDILGTDVDGMPPYVRVVHKKNEEAIFTAISSRYEIVEV